MLHRSTSSRRYRASRNMTNLGRRDDNLSTTAAPKGRRASVATEKPLDLPQTSPRRTVERQRSPRGSFVPDIALDTENDSSDESINHVILLDRDQYGGSRTKLSQKVNRNIGNSLVPSDYYRSPWNGARSPRNSLILDTGLTTEMLHGSRHSLVPEAALSPRNSLVPSVHNRSPRNSLVPLTGSRTSLMSENGTSAPSRSPRHSLVPNSSRSPRGSITNIEMVDRSPQRSPRGSIASECLNQSPRNSIVLYEQVSRSSRGSLGIGDIPRGAIGANEEEMRSPQRSIDPDIIDRTPRGSSLSGLQERRGTKASLMAQDPRRASADQGLSGSRNSFPYRQKETNIGYMKSGGTVIQTNLGYGPYLFGDSRRQSSSVSQLSGDESRRLFTSGNGAKIPESTLENGKHNVITYGSVVFQLKDANLEASSTCDFVFRGLKVVSKTRVVTGSLILLFLVPVLMLIFGWKFYNQCPIESTIPTYMIIGGIFGMILMSLTIYAQIRSRTPEILTVPPTPPQISLSKVITVVLTFFLTGWFVLGNRWILHVWWPPDKAPLMDPDMFCKRELYTFAVIHLGVIYVVLVIILFVMMVLASFRIIACPFSERYR